MSKHSDFVMESRPYGDRMVNHVQITCGACEKDTWVVAKDGGWAIRTFRQRGWRVGSKPKQHRCPDCALTHRIHIPDNPVMPTELGRMLKTKIMEDHVRDALLGSTAITREPLLPPPDVKVEFSDYAKDKLQGKHEEPPIEVAFVIVSSQPETPPAPAPEPAVAHVKAKRASRGVSGVTVFSRRDNAARSGVNNTGSVDGLDFFTVPLGDGWCWKHARDTTDAEKKAWAASRKVGLRIVKRGPNSKKGPTPQHVATMTVPVIDDQGHKRTRLLPLSHAILHDNTTEEPTMAQPELTTEDTMTDNVTQLRQPTRDDRSLIHDELTKCYDVVAQRYSKSDSDKTVAARLDMPRVWITDLRTMFFGDHDRNQASDLKIKELDAAIEVAKAGVLRLMEMAAEAEALEVKLTAARKALG